MKKAIAALVGIALLVGPAIAADQGEAKPLTGSQFAELVERLSEEGGYFWNDNFVSNESSYLHPLGKMRELGLQGGIYLGVGPNQNFTYIAKLHPRYAFILDIRRQNLLEHLLFKATFHLARNRAEYLSILLSRPLPKDRAFEADNNIDDLVRHFETQEPDIVLFRRNQSRIRSFLKSACRLKLNQQELESIHRIHTAFFLRGLSIKYDYIPVATYGEFLRERDLEGKQQNFLNSNHDFLYLKRLQEENRIIPLVGDFAGTHAVREIGRYLKEHGEIVRIFYTSNVEQYLIRNQTYSQFLLNLKALPLDDRSVFIRAYWSNRVPHPDAVPNYSFTQILQWAKPFLQAFTEDSEYNYWDVVTTGLIKLR